MRRLAGVQTVCFLAAGVAVMAPGFVRLAQHWSSYTIYPWWVMLYALGGAAAALVCLRRPNATSAPAVQVALMVAAGQLAGLGFVAAKHWRPAFGMGGGYAGAIDDLEKLAVVIGLAGTIAAVAAIAQLVASQSFPQRPSLRDALIFAGAGVLLLVGLPFGIAEGDSGLLDPTSLGAFVLIYSGPLGVGIAGAGWLAPRLRAAAIGSCAAAAAVSASDLMTDLTHLQGRPALLVTAVVLAVAAVVVSRVSRPSTAPTGIGT